jgi:hypothetical protein
MNLSSSLCPSGIQVLGLLCTVDLFPAPPILSGSNQKDSKSQATAALPRKYFPSPTTSQFPGENKQHTFMFVSSHPYSLSPDQMATSMEPMSPLGGPTPTIPGFLPASYSASDIVHYIGEYPVTEESKMTQALVGATFIQASVVEYQGKMSIMFVFSVSLASHSTRIIQGLTCHHRTWP